MTDIGEIGEIGDTNETIEVEVEVGEYEGWIINGRIVTKYYSRIVKINVPKDEVDLIKNFEDFKKGFRKLIA